MTFVAKMVLVLGVLGMSACVMLLSACGAFSDHQCKVTALVIPQTATADHAASAPANQVQFSTSFKVEGSCALPQYITDGAWGTSDPANTKVVTGSQPNVGIATCLNATPTPVTVTYTGTQSGYSFTPATLTCK